MPRVWSALRLRCRPASVRRSAIVLAVLLPVITPAAAQEDPQHASCRAYARIDQQEGCVSYTLALPTRPPADGVGQPVEELGDLIPGVTRITKRFPRPGNSFCAEYTWDPVLGVCSASSPECPLPEPARPGFDCGSGCFCVFPGEGLELDRTDNRPFLLFGGDDPVSFELRGGGATYMIALPRSLAGWKASQVFRALNRHSEIPCVTRISRLECNGSRTAWFVGADPSSNFTISPGEAYLVRTEPDSDIPPCHATFQIGTSPEAMPRADWTASFGVSGVSGAESWSWGADAIWTRPYAPPIEFEALDLFAPGPAPGAIPPEIVQAFVADINAQDAAEVRAQAEGDVLDGDRFCLLGTEPFDPVLWVADAGVPPDEGCDVNDSPDCPLLGEARITLSDVPMSWLRMGPFFVRWTGSANVYDVVSGDLGELLATGGEFLAATRECLASGTTGLETSHEPVVVAPGQGAWFLVRASNRHQRGTYDTPYPSQHGSRDPGIDMSPGGCP